MFRAQSRRTRRRHTLVRATPLTFGLLGRVLFTTAVVVPLLLIVAALGRAPHDADGQFNAFYFIVFPAAIVFVLMMVPPLWRPGRRLQRTSRHRRWLTPWRAAAEPEPTRLGSTADTPLSRSGTPPSSSRS